MADGFIVRKGGVAVERTTAPSINFVSKTDTEIVVTFTNNDAAEAEVYYGITSTLTDTVTLAAAATSSNITFSGLTQNTAVTVSAYALVTDPTSKKIKSEIVSTVITTDAIIYTAATGGTTLEYNSGGKRFKSHTFLEDGNFVVSTVGDNVDDRNKVDYLIIGGGGSGGSAYGGGGGAGGFRTTVGTQGGGGTLGSKVVVIAQDYSIDVGAGGASNSAGYERPGITGDTSSALGITSNGGGGGGAGDNNPGGQNGASGGGGANAASGGTGISGQGFAGGTGGSSFPNIGSAGGGGAFAVGANGTSTAGGNGGAGLANTLRDGTSETRTGGGGGGTYQGGTAGTGGAGGGGNAGSGSGFPNNGVAGTANTGSGGGGASADPYTTVGGQGGKGIVIIRYEIAPSV